MRRKYKLMIIILTSIGLAYLIYFSNFSNKINIVALGDAIASGETPYNIDGISFNDYVKDYYESKKLLGEYNYSYAYKNYELNNLLSDLKDNTLNEKDHLTIQQLLHKANMIIISIGEEELVRLAITNDLEKENINKFIIEYDNLIATLKEISESKIILISIYENKYIDKSKAIIINSELSNIASKYDCIFLNINDLMKDKNYFISKDSYYFNYKGHKEIAKLIINSV